jgi:hypothetical protein
MKLIKRTLRNLGCGSPREEEKVLSDIKFDKFKFTSRQPPSDKKDILFISCFGEFGCESMALMYCIPRIVQDTNYYTICVGWHGREYLYRHLVDEFWGVKEEYQWMREYSNGLKNSSKNIVNLEKSLSNHGRLCNHYHFSAICFQNKCKSCGNVWYKSKLPCTKCGSSDTEWGILNDVKSNKSKAIKIPSPSKDCLDHVAKYLKTNSVGIFARGRACWGRNLSKDFYVELINFLRSKGYDPIWLGEKQSILPCPVSDVTDFSVTEDASKLELTLALISKLKFTVQFWTASTRLASMVDTPWILFESPDQIVGNGQEGLRIALTSDFNKRKLILAQYKNIAENESIAFKYLDQAISDLELNNWDDIIGPVENPGVIKNMLQKQESWR